MEMKEHFVLLMKNRYKKRNIDFLFFSIVCSALVDRMSSCSLEKESIIQLQYIAMQ